MKRRPQIVESISTFGSNVDNRQRGRRQDLIDKLIPRFSFLSVMRRIIEFYRNDRRQIPIAKNEIDVLAIDSIEVRLPGTGAFADINEVSESDLCEESMVWRQPSQHFIKRTLSGREEILLL